MITKIIDTPAWPILSASDSTDHIRNVAQILTSKSSQSKWLDKLESGKKGEIIRFYQNVDFHENGTETSF